MTTHAVSHAGTQPDCSGRRISQVPPTDSAVHLATLPSAQLIARYRKGVENFDRRLFKLNEPQIDQAFLPEADVGRWPVRVLLGHLADADLAQSHRMRRAVGEDNPVLSVWDENAFIDHGVYGLDHRTSSPGAADPAAEQHRVMNVLGGNVALIHTLRQWTGQWLSTLTEAQLGRTAMHPERGPLTVKLMLAYMVWHLEHHARFLACKLDRLVGPDVEDETPKGGCGAGCGCKSK